MRRRQVVVLSFLVCFVLGSVALHAERKPVAVSASLEALPGRVLPGVTSIFRVSLRNEGRGDVLVNNGAILEASRDDGPFFQVKWEGELVAGPFEPESPARLRKGETSLVYFGSSLDFYQNYWLADHRLCEPGVYRLRMRMEVAVAPRRTAPDEEADRIQFLELETTEVVSPEAVLVIEEPTGADFEAWEFLRNEGAGGWCAPQWQWVKQATVATLLERWPESRYAPYAALRVSSIREGMSREQQAEACAEGSERFLEKYSDSPVGPLFAFRVTTCRSEQARMVAARDLARANELASAAKAAVSKPFATAPDFWEERLELERNGVPTHANLERIYVLSVAHPDK